MENFERVILWIIIFGLFLMSLGALCIASDFKNKYEEKIQDSHERIVVLETKMDIYTTVGSTND